MSGIEFYPQKEFDEDMEDKSDNDKIRVSGSVLSLTLICPMIFPPLQENDSLPALLSTQLDQLSLTLMHCFL